MGFPIAQVKALPQQLSQAVAFIGVGQVGGITLALMISNSIFLNEATDKISAILPSLPKSVVQQAISGVRGSFFSTLSPDDRMQVLAAIVHSVDNVFIMIITAGALSLVLSVFMKREKLFVSAAEQREEKSGANERESISALA